MHSVDVERKLACYKNESYPIAAMVRIRQAAFNKIHHFDVIQALGAASSFLSHFCLFMIFVV